LAVPGTGESMDAKRFLRQYEEADRKARKYKQEYEFEQEKIDSVRSTFNTDGTPRSSGISRRVEDQAIRLADKAMKWKVAELDAIRIRQEVFEVVMKIPGIEGEILYERYVNLRIWEAVCLEVHASWYTVHSHHKKALAMVNELINQT